MTNVLTGHVLSSNVHQSSRQQIRSSRAVTAAFARPAFRARKAERTVARAAEEKNADLSGEWPVNWSLASYEDVGEFFKNSLFKEDAGNLLKDVMATSVKSVTPETRLDSIGNLFDSISGAPVTKSQSDRTLVGVLSKKDLSKVGSCKRGPCKVDHFVMLTQVMSAGGFHCGRHHVITSNCCSA